MQLADVQADVASGPQRLRDLEQPPGRGQIQFAPKGDLGVGRLTGDDLQPHLGCSIGEDTASRGVTVPVTGSTVRTQPYGRGRKAV